jgi:hypothetical protein
MSNKSTQYFGFVKSKCRKKLFSSAIIVEKNLRQGIRAGYGLAYNGLWTVVFLMIRVTFRQGWLSLGGNA